VNYKFIAIEGTIGAGKTTLAKMLASELQTTLLLEEFAENPHLQDFYTEPEKHALTLELSLLVERYNQLTEQAALQQLHESACISDYYFIKSLLFANINLPEPQFLLFKKVFELVTAPLPNPDLIIYLYRPVAVLKAAIVKRGRAYEQHITNAYLASVQQAYMNYFKPLKDKRVLLLNIGELDFEKKKDDYKKIVTLINKSYPLGVTELNL
jgi:deoxyadenosine/deoxycytidine kinase